MSLLVQPHAALGDKRPSDYEQLINYTMLYDSGDECVDVTGGWSKYFTKDDSGNYFISYGIGEKKTDCLNVNASGSRAVISIGTNNFVDTSEYSYIGVIANPITMDSSYGRTDVSLISDDSTNLDDAHSCYPMWAPYSFNVSNRNVNVSPLKKTSSETHNSSNDEPYTWYGTGRTYKPTSRFFVFANTDPSGTVRCEYRNIFLTKPDDFTTLCSKAGLSTPTSLEALLANTTSLATIFNNEDAVKFMVAQCTGDFMVSVLSDEAAVEALKASPYLNLVVANPHWAKFAMMIPNAKSIFGFTMLYDEGDECVDVTGGLTSVTKNQTSGYEMSLTKNANNMYLSYSGRYWRYRHVYTTNNIDFTDFVGIAINGKSTNPDIYPHVSVGTWDANTWDGNYLKWGYVAKANNINGLLICDLPAGESITSHAVFGFGRGNSQSGSGNMYLYHMFMYKADDWQTLCTKANIIAPTDIATLIADSTAMTTIMSNEEAVKHLMGCTGDLMVSILNNAVSVSAIAASALATQYLTSHPTWAKFIKMIPACADAGLDLLV